MTLPHRPPVPSLSGERFRVRYLLTGSAEETRAKAQDICIEQTVEFPADLVPGGDICDHIVGQIEQFEQLDGSHFAATISYAIEIAGSGLPQLLNVIFGNTSLLPGIRVERLDLPDSLLAFYKGPRFGLKGLRETLNVPDRPLLCTAAKPMGLSARHLADIAYQCALGGLDIIKDDHGIVDQAFSPFAERVERCAEAVQRANRQTGLSCLYAANVTAPAHLVVERALFARQAGASAFVLSPMLVGFDAMHQLAEDERLGLPILSHPTFGGGFVSHPDSGFSHYVFYGQIHRLAGADASIYVSYGGRFPVSREDCREAMRGCYEPMGHLKPICPTPGGGMTLPRIPELRKFYGREVMFLVGGDLHKAGDNLVENARRFVRLVE